jgi:hypothetical protein
MDDADMSDSHIELLLSSQIEKARSPERQLIPIGQCHYCSDPVPQHHLFCSPDCSEDHRHMMERKKANGL